MRRYPLAIGAWLSLVERLVRDQEAGGSNPLAPTNLNRLFEAPQTNERKRSINKDAVQVASI